MPRHEIGVALTSIVPLLRLPSMQPLFPYDRLRYRLLHTYTDPTYPYHFLLYWTLVLLIALLILLLLQSIKSLRLQFLL